MEPVATAKKAEGNEEQRRQAAREAKREGKSASEAGATRGASTQRRHVKGKASHEERFTTREAGKTGAAGEGRKNPQPHNDL